MNRYPSGMTMPAKERPVASKIVQMRQAAARISAALA
jgi:hypothetical protein